MEAVSIAPPGQAEDTRPEVWVIADTETPSLRKEDGIVELGLREIDPDTLETLWEIQSLIDCGDDIEIDPGAQAIHGISKEMLVGEPTMEEFVNHPDYLNNRYAGKKIIMICHNASFDVPRLDAIGDITTSICTLFHARQLVPKGGDGPENHKLGTLREYFGFPPNEAHRALADVATTHRLLVELMGRTNRNLRDFHATQETTVHRMPWGKHCGMLLYEVPPSYLQWLWNLPDLEKNLKTSIGKVMTNLKISKKAPK